MRVRASHKGFTLVEVLVALLVLAIGLLGMATLMMTSLQSSQNAYLRSQVSVLAQDLVERMRTNRAQAITSDNYELTTSAPATTKPNCSAAGCSPIEQAQLDLHDWRAALEAGIPGAIASIARNDPNQYTITITWEGNATEDSDDDPATPNSPAMSTFVLRVNL